jgi:hypothetical protein
VDVDDGFEIQISQGETFKTTITIDDNLFQYVKALHEDSSKSTWMAGEN